MSKRSGSVSKLGFHGNHAPKKHRIWSTTDVLHHIVSFLRVSDAYPFLLACQVTTAFIEEMCLFHINKTSVLFNRSIQKVSMSGPHLYAYFYMLLSRPEKDNIRFLQLNFDRNAFRLCDRPMFPNLTRLKIVSEGQVDILPNLLGCPRLIELTMWQQGNKRIRDPNEAVIRADNFASRLEHLDLGGCLAIRVESLPSSLRSFTCTADFVSPTSLVWPMGLRYCCLKDFSCDPVLTNWAHCTALETLKVKTLSLSAQQLHQLPPNLTYLDCNDLHFDLATGDARSVVFVPYLPVSLKTLILRKPQEHAELDFRKYVYLQHLRVQVVGVAHLPPPLEHLQVKNIRTALVHCPSSLTGLDTRLRNVACFRGIENVVQFYLRFFDKSDEDDAEKQWYRRLKHGHLAYLVCVLNQSLAVNATQRRVALQRNICLSLKTWYKWHGISPSLQQLKNVALYGVSFDFQNGYPTKHLMFLCRVCKSVLAEKDAVQDKLFAVVSGSKNQILHHVCCPECQRNTTHRNHAASKKITVLRQSPFAYEEFSD